MLTERINLKILHLRIIVESNDSEIINSFEDEFSFFKLSEQHISNCDDLHITIITSQKKYFFPTIIQHNGTILSELSHLKKNTRRIVDNIFRFLYKNYFGRRLLDHFLHKYYSITDVKPLIKSNLYKETIVNFSSNLFFQKSILSYFTFQIAELSAPKYLFIHGGAISVNNEATLIVGKTHQGKTTIVLGLLRRGVSFFSDDITVINRYTLRVIPFPLKLNIRSNSPYFKYYFDDKFLNRTDSNLLIDPNVFFPDSLAEECKVKNIIFLEGQPEPESSPVINRISSYQAMSKLCKYTLSDKGTMKNKLNILSSLVGDSNSFRLKTGEIDSTLDMLVDIIN